MPNITPREAIAKIKQELNKNLSDNATDQIIEYSHVALAFPGKLRQDSFELKAIDFVALKSWADRNGWLVDTSPETTPEDMKTSPNIIFKRAR